MGVDEEETQVEVVGAQVGKQPLVVEGWWLLRLATVTEHACGSGLETLPQTLVVVEGSSPSDSPQSLCGLGSEPIVQQSDRTVSNSIAIKQHAHLPLVSRTQTDPGLG